MTRAAGLLAALALACATPAAAGPARIVDPLIGTAGSAAGGPGATFPGPVAPFGMVQLSPDTTPAVANFAGGYSYDDSHIRGFSLKHLSGAGCPVYQDVPLMPTTGGPIPFAAAAAPFSHADEEASAGRYRVRLGGGVDVELTATPRTGAGRFTYPPGAIPGMLVNAGGSALGNLRGEVRIDPARREVSGSTTSGAFCWHDNLYTPHFAIRFSRGFRAWGTWRRGRLRGGATRAADRVRHRLSANGFRTGPSSDVGAWVTFDGPRVEARAGISYVSVDGARRNLAREAAGVPFDTLRRRAERRWDAVLGRVGVAGGSDDDRRRFYTALYHAHIHPSLFSDADGRYRGADGRVHTAPAPGHFTDVAGWDVYRTQLPLLAMLQPRVAAAVVRSLLAGARQTGWLPKWTLADDQMSIMVGDPAAPIVAAARALGVRGVDYRAALRALVRNARTAPSGRGYVARPGLAEYLRHGYVPHEAEAPPGVTAAGPLVWGTALTTLEYAIADSAIARLAAALGARRLAREFARGAASWRRLFDPATGYVAPRRRSGEFVAGEPTSDAGFVEGSRAQYTWMVPHDPAGLIAALGGPGAAAARLDELLAELNTGPHSVHAFLGNQPTMHTPWLYDWLGCPQRTQAAVRRALLELSHATPLGLPGNDDLGTLSAWYVFAALGFYPVVPGTDELALASPLFPKAIVRLPDGRRLRIEAPGARAGAPFARAIRLGGAPLERPLLRWSELREAGTLAMDLGSHGPSACAPDG